MKENQGGLGLKRGLGKDRNGRGVGDSSARIYIGRVLVQGTCMLMMRF